MVPDLPPDAPAEPYPPDDAPHPDRPRYRALASPTYDHEPGSCVPEDPMHGGHLGFCHHGWSLEVYRVDLGWRRAGGESAYAPVFTTWQLGSAWDPTALRARVVDVLTTLVAPLTTRTTAADVELYRRVHQP